MTDLERAAEPVWDEPTKAAFDKFIQAGGTAETWNRANSDLAPAPSAPTAAAPAKRPATGADVWAQIERDKSAAADAMAKARFAYRQRQAARGRQGR